jgi:alkylation response protein AidB-like acyl-CoA dehydrogenase
LITRCAALSLITPPTFCALSLEGDRRAWLGQVGKGVNVLMSGLDYERAVLAAGPLV